MINKKLIIGFVVLFLSVVRAPSFCQDKTEELIKKEVLIEVKPNTIVLPEGEVALIPISVARVRSTELRDLNKKYNAVTIEKIYEMKKTKEVVKEELKLKGLKDTLVAEEKKQEKEKIKPVDLTKIFTRNSKKEYLNEGKEIEEVKSVFIFHFELKPEVKIEDLLLEYKGVTSVVNVEVVIRTVKNEKEQSTTAQK